MRRWKGFRDKERGERNGRTIENEKREKDDNKSVRVCVKVCVCVCSCGGSDRGGGEQ